MTAIRLFGLVCADETRGSLEFIEANRVLRTLSFGAHHHTRAI